MAQGQSVLKYSAVGVYLHGIGAGYNGAPGAIGTYGTLPGQFKYPHAAAVDSSGNVYVADNSAHRIQEFDSAGNYLTQFGMSGTGVGQFSNPFGVAVDSAGSVYVADISNNRITEYARASASVSGTITFNAIYSGAVAQNVTFEFRPNNNFPVSVQTLAVPASGVYTLSGLFNTAGVLHIKPDKYLAINLSINLTGGILTGQNTVVEAGDSNNDNTVDSTGFGNFIGYYGDIYNINSPSASAGVATVDFNGDGSIDATDFGLLIGSFNEVGDP